MSEDERPEMRHSIRMHGAVIVNGGYAHVSHADVVCAYIDLASKYAVAAGSIGGEASVPGVFLAATERTLHLDESKDRNAETWVEFPDYVGWHVFAAEVARYTLSVCLIAPTP